jgi:hypothetical protein
MRKFQRVAVVAAAIAGLSALGAGVGFAHDKGHDKDDDGTTAVASSQSNAVAYDDDGDGHGGRHGTPDTTTLTPANTFDLGNITNTTTTPSK